MALHDLYVAIFEKSGGNWAARHGQDGAGYQKSFNEFVKAGMRPACVSSHATGNSARFASVFTAGGGTWEARHGIDAAAYQKMFDDFVPKGYHPVFINGYNVGNKDFYNGLWEKSAIGAWGARHGLDSNGYQAFVNDSVAKGLRPRWVSCYNVGGTVRYATWWEKAAGSAWEARHGLNPDAFQAFNLQMAAKGYRPRMISACNAGAGDVFAGIWEKDGGPATQVHVGLTSDTYQQRVDALVAQGWRVKHVHGYAGAQPLDVMLRYTHQMQQQSNWCWSATSVSIRRYYQPGSTLTQCQLVNSRRGLSNCCTSGSSDACNKPDKTAQALNGLGHLASDQGSSSTRAKVASELAAGRPLGIRIKWQGTDVGHANVICGMDEGDLLIVRDSIYGDQVLDFDVFSTAYQTNGSWDRTYFTKA